MTGAGGVCVAERSSARTAVGRRRRARVEVKGESLTREGRSALSVAGDEKMGWCRVWVMETAGRPVASAVTVVLTERRETTTEYSNVCPAVAMSASVSARETRRPTMRATTSSGSAGLEAMETTEVPGGDGAVARVRETRVVGSKETTASPD
jgi:hypothetical protein